MKLLKYGGAVTGLKEEQAIIRSIRNSRKTANWQQAEEGALFEKELANYVGTKHATLTNSGSSAGLLALSALELPHGSEVLIPAVTFPTIFNIILQCNLTPVVIDCEPGTYTLNPTQLEKLITPNTKAIICVHALGNPCDMDAIMKFAKKHALYVIEDNCDGLGSTYKGKQLGSFGHISFTSLHAAHIVSMGVGGCIFTDDKELAKNVRRYRDWGRQADVKEKWNGTKWSNIPPDQDSRFIYEKIGYNFQILDLQAAMGRVQLRKIKKIKELRKKHFDYLYEHLKKFPDLLMPVWLKESDVCWFAFPITTIGKRKPLLHYLESKGIETRSMFAGNITKHPAYKNVKYGFHDLSASDYILEHSFWISCHPRLTKSDLVYIIKAFKEFYA